MTIGTVENEPISPFIFPRKWRILVLASAKVNAVQQQAQNPAPKTSEGEVVELKMTPVGIPATLPNIQIHKFRTKIIVLTASENEGEHVETDQSLSPAARS